MLQKGKPKDRKKCIHLTDRSFTMCAGILGMQGGKDKVLALRSSEMGKKYHMELVVAVCSEWDVTCPR